MYVHSATNSSCKALNCQDGDFFYRLIKKSMSKSFVCFIQSNAKLGYISKCSVEQKPLAYSFVFYIFYYLHSISNLYLSRYDQDLLSIALIVSYKFKKVI